MTVLFVIATIILFLMLDWFTRKVRSKQILSVRSPVLSTTNGSYPVRVPEGIFFAPSHTWLTLFPSGKIRLGVDDFISRLLDKPEIVMLKHAGDHVRQGDPLMHMKQANHSLTIRSPIDGEILAVNEELAQNPLLLRERLFSDGWSYMLKPKNLSRMKNMLIGSETRMWIQEEFRRLRDLLAGVGRDGAIQPACLQDGGPPFSGALATMDDAFWKKLDTEFLTVE